jgi:hypothetical protein
MYERYLIGHSLQQGPIPIVYSFLGVRFFSIEGITKRVPDFIKKPRAR